ncbi:hypothetical protein NX794_22785 [Streptomyces sp. LP11]|uniref:Integral membrane protein n=1 Tax=Streptomyces pyxinicus TaxID=2970331 RepID=A0ABT2B676_9ACTN|nr:hypothetical protein [Streptomyces sp. LP11]MCS0604014.1 hypothetical protein [Streptomyces sp. LP11]
MGWTVLYIAFGVVALWLLGEVLLQYKARLRWRLLAFAGFVGVVVGVLMPSVIVIGLGAIAFATGQTYVTLSFRRGFAAGWAVKRPEAGTPAGGGSKRRRGRTERPAPAPEGAPGPATGELPAHLDTGYDDDYDRDDVFTPARPADPSAAESTAVYAPQPLPDDTGNYGVYGDTYAGAAPAQGADQNHAYDYPAYGQQDYGYDAGGQQAYANYSDPYIGAQPYGDASYDPGYGQQQYDRQGYPQEPYTGGYDGTPAGGVWVPQQRTDEAPGGELPQEQPHPYQQDGRPQQSGAGYDERYRF